MLAYFRSVWHGQSELFRKLSAYAASHVALATITLVWVILFYSVGEQNKDIPLGFFGVMAIFLSLLSVHFAMNYLIGSEKLINKALQSIFFALGVTWYTAFAFIGGQMISWTDELMRQLQSDGINTLGGLLIAYVGLIALTSIMGDIIYRALKFDSSDNGEKRKRDSFVEDTSAFETDGRAKLLFIEYDSPEDYLSTIEQILEQEKAEAINDR